MMNLYKKISLLLVLLLLCPIPGRASAEVPITMAGFEEADNGRSWAENQFFKRMEEKFALDFAFQQFGDKAAYQAFLSSLKKDQPDLPQVLFKAQLSPQMAQSLYDQGVLINLLPHLKDHAPHFYQLYQEREDLRQAITLQDGAVVALPYISLKPSQNVLWINQDWLNTLKLPMPSDVLSLEETLRAFIEKDPNRNGKQDETGLSFLGPYDLKYLAHAWGLASNDFNIFLQDGQVRYLATQAEFTDFLSWCNMAFQQGLLDKDGFSTVDVLRKQTDPKAVNTLGAFFAPLPSLLIPLEWSQQYRALPPLAYQGTTRYRSITSPIFTGTFALTTACQDVPAMLAFVDDLYTGEGAVLASIGKEGEDYVFDGDGSWRLLWEGNDRAYLTQAIIASGWDVPGISSDDFQQLYTDKTVGMLGEQIALVAASAVQPFPPFPLSQAQIEEIAPLQAQLGRYVDESIARFVIGEVEINDENIAAFHQQLEDLGLTAFLDFWQAIYDRGQAHDD